MLARLAKTGCHFLGATCRPRCGGRGRNGSKRSPRRRSSPLLHARPSRSPRCQPRGLRKRHFGRSMRLGIRWPAQRHRPTKGTCATICAERLKHAGGRKSTEGRRDRSRSDTCSDRIWCRPGLASDLAGHTPQTTSPSPGAKKFALQSIFAGSTLLFSRRISFNWNAPLTTQEHRTHGQHLLRTAVHRDAGR